MHAVPAVWCSFASLWALFSLWPSDECPVGPVGKPPEELISWTDTSGRLEGGTIIQSVSKREEPMIAPFWGSYQIAEAAKFFWHVIDAGGNVLTVVKAVDVFDNRTCTHKVSLPLDFHIVANASIKYQVVMNFTITGGFTQTYRFIPFQLDYHSGMVSWEWPVDALFEEKRNIYIYIYI